MTYTPDPDCRPWLVLCVRGSRVASVPLTPHNLDTCRRLYAVQLVQRDAGGTEYHDIRRIPQQRELRGVSFDTHNR